MNDNNERRYPRPIPRNLIPNEYTPDKFQQERLEKAPLRAIRIKGDALRAVLRSGNQLDWSDIHERFVDLWAGSAVGHLARPALQARPRADPTTGKSVLTFVADEKLVLQALDTTRGILDSLVKLRREMDRDAARIPRWAIERIELALRNHPEAMNELLKELAAEGEKQAEME